tara:strand:+ start:345 stop:908 length:564 start_codon:yes stop_codon:yes gene_type:complete
MRIISGSLKGKKLFQPIDKNTRPLKDLVKESIFNILQHSTDNKVDLLNSNILDLFSGTGSFGIECLSRGAKNVFFCENYQNSIKILEKNINYLNLEGRSEIIKKSAYDIKNHFLNKKKMDLIFLDPPFKDKNLNLIIINLEREKIVTPKTIVIIHRNKKNKEKINSKFKISKEKNFGLSKILFGKII